MKSFLLSLSLIFVFLFSVYSGKAFTELSPEVKISLLTCSPGSDLYSVFGHSAIRVKDPINKIDSVYNYGTFDFNTENFYLKFSRGKLDYTLSRQPFAWFQYTYIEERRAIREQILDLTLEEKQAFYDILETNHLPQNRDYKYHFFFDNCATKIRDKLKESLGDKLIYHHPVDTSRTFREMIQLYLRDMPWSDFGIDIALGLPCDDELQPGDGMFLPDGLYLEFKHATVDGKPLVSSDKEILPAEHLPPENALFTPSFVLWILFGISLILALFSYLRKKRLLWLDRLWMVVSGLIGLMVFLLWFATDHTTTADNFNLLWAIPLNLIFVFLTKKSNRGIVRKYFQFQTVLLLLVLALWSVIPQSYHVAFIPLILIFALSSCRLGWVSRNP